MNLYKMTIIDVAQRDCACVAIRTHRAIPMKRARDELPKPIRLHARRMGQENRNGLKSPRCASTESERPKGR